MDESKERMYVCKYCKKKFPSGKSLGGHIRIHTNEYSVDSDSYNGDLLRENPKKNDKRLVDQREIVARKQQRQEQICCTKRGKGFDSLKALGSHMDSHCEGEKTVMDTQSDTETSSAPTSKRSKTVMKQSNSESFGNASSSSPSEIDQDDNYMAKSLLMLSRGLKDRDLVVNSLAESSENNSVILETKSSSGEQLKIFNVKNQVLETDKVAVDGELRSADDDSGAIFCDSDRSSFEYYTNGPKKSDSDISVDGSLRNTGSGFSRFRNSDELGVKEGGSKYELSKRKRVLPSYESDSCADTNSKIHRSSDKPPVVKKAGGTEKKSKGHECPICFKVFKSGQALGGHKRSHSIANQEHRIERQVPEMHHDQIDLNRPATDSDE